MIDALQQANRALMETTVAEATVASFVMHKGDTLGIDQVPENTIASVLTDFDQYAVLITEERGEDANPLAHQSEFSVRGPRTFFVCDPCDRSDQFCSYLSNNKRGARFVGDVLRKKNAKRVWEKSYAGPCTITGANAAITCVRRGLPICSVILNFITQHMTIACSAGIYVTPITEQLYNTTLTLADVDKTKRLSFPNLTRERNEFFVTFMGKPQRGYPQNFAMTKLAIEDNVEQHLHYKLPGGPTRILYLSNHQPKEDAIGFIVANGEKIGEWIHWLPFVRFAYNEDDRGGQALQLYEVRQDQSKMRDGYQMTPSQPYTIFKDTKSNRTIIDVDKLGDFDNPSKYRATLLITSATNTWAIRRSQQYGYRQLVF